MKFSYRKQKFGGRKFTRLYEAILPSSFSLTRLFGHPLILLEDSERMITDEQIRMARQDVAVLLEKAENEKEVKLTSTEKPLADSGYWTVGMNNGSHRIKVYVLQLLKNACFSNLQRTQIDGRSIISIDFAPKPNAVFEKTLAYFSKTEGQIRIDETDKRITSIEGDMLGEYAKHKEKSGEERRKKALFLFLQIKVAEDFWFPQVVRLNFVKHSELFDAVEIEYTFSKYNKGRVDIQFVEDAVEKINKTTTEN